MITATSKHLLLLKKDTTLATKVKPESDKYCQQYWALSYKPRAKKIAFHSHH
jgi:hypothetical protein